MAALRSRCGHYIFALWFLSIFYLLSFFIPRLISAAAGWMSTILPHMVWPYNANLERRSEMCCTRLTGNTGCKNDAKKNRHLRTIAQLCRAISSQLRHASTIGKNLLSSNISITCPYNTVNVGPLAADIFSLVWGIPANFNGFRVLAALLHSQTAALNRRRHLYSTGRPSRWALAHISSSFIYLPLSHSA